MAQARRVVRHDAQEELGLGVELGDLVELVAVVKRHLLDADRPDEADVRVGLAKLGVDDALGGHPHGQHLLDLRLGSAFEAGAEGGEQAEDLGVGVALDGVKWLDPG